MARYQIRNRLRHKQLVDLGNQPLVRIESKGMAGWARKIVDVKTDIVYETELVDQSGSGVHTHKYVMRRDGDVVAESYLESADLRQRRAAPRLRNLKHLEIQTPYGLWCVLRGPNNSAVVVCGEQVIADVTPYSALKQQFIQVYARLDVAYMAGIYMFILYMIGEDHPIPV